MELEFPGSLVCCPRRDFFRSGQYFSISIWWISQFWITLPNFIFHQTIKYNAVMIDMEKKNWSNYYSNEKCITSKHNGHFSIHCFLVFSSVQYSDKIWLNFCEEPPYKLQLCIFFCKANTKKGLCNLNANPFKLRLIFTLLPKFI